MSEGLIITRSFPLELRQEGNTLSGRFPYNEESVIADRGSVRKERFAPRAFRFAVEDESRPIDLLVGHDFNRPLAKRLEGSLELRDTDSGVEFIAHLPPEGERPSWMVDAVLSVRNRLMNHVSPGFRRPPANVVSDAVALIPEPGNPGVQIREVREAVLRELSLVTNPQYPGSSLDLRNEQTGLSTPHEGELWRLL